MKKLIYPFAFILMNIKVLFTALLTTSTLVFSQDEKEDNNLPLIIH